MKREYGFTLLEVLGSIGLLGLLLLLIAGSFSTANRTVESTSQFADRLDEVRASQRFLRDALQNIKPVALIQEQKQLFEGEATYLRFTSPTPIDLGGKLTIHRLELFRTQNGELQLRVVFFERNGAPWGQPQVLMHQLRQAQFRYRGVDEKRNQTAWLAQWPWPERLPESVQLYVDVDGPVRWPQMTVALRAGQTQGVLR
ncbi:prepilin-type N-terminal cleavage/methylation domain-containing protein [Pseudomonas capsici]|uniref:prepilin-type N-terminal cleavage/methylation domain-containing protein n=1 Tax=Pseudomonas capsici TaxID=2810614 RepID=UPI000E3ED284|nr:prepilin-type N-terminal cleavage/methylation domain-containing protein [Pseudomonas capsici]MCV4286461.1 prepilin-type N-terminal cleavage/methylation domain-containing protein [Pseudomonas capsici]